MTIVKQAWTWWSTFHNKESKNEDHSVETKINIWEIEYQLIYFQWIFSMKINSVMYYYATDIYEANNP